VLAATGTGIVTGAGEEDPSSRRRGRRGKKPKKTFVWNLEKKTQPKNTHFQTG
jgi:hypothetical protein